MGGNLAKSPLAAVFYAGLLWLVAGVLPKSEAYAELAAGFTMPLFGVLTLVGYALVICIAAAIAFGGANAKGFGVVIFLLLTSCGSQWVLPLLPDIMLGETTGTLTRGDLLLLLGGGCGGTLVLMILLMALYKGENISDAGKKQPETKPKLNILGLVIRLLVLPVIFCVAYYLLWYFLLWTKDAPREYYGQTELGNFMAEIIDILINKGFQVVVHLLQGLGYALFSLPLLLKMPAKRIQFIAANTLFYLSGAVLYLIPNPIMPAEVRMPHFFMALAANGVYGILAGLLLHTAYRKEGLPAKAEKKAAASKKAAEDDAPKGAPAVAAAGAGKK